MIDQTLGSDAWVMEYMFWESLVQDIFNITNLIMLAIELRELMIIYTFSNLSN